MSWNHVATHNTDMHKDEVLRLYNQERRTNYVSFALLAAAVGLTTISFFIKEKTVPRAAAAIAAASASITYDDAFRRLEVAIDHNKLADAVDKLLDYNGTYIRIITDRYEWSSGSGNHYTWKTEHQYKFY